VNAPTLDGESALHIASYQADVVKLLIQNGADVNAVNKKKETPLHDSAHGGHADVAKVLIQNGADVNAVDCEKSTALHAAIGDPMFFLSNYGADVATLLIKNGVDVNAVNKDKASALSCLVGKNGHIDIMNRLVLQLLCFGVEIDKFALRHDKWELLRPINDRVNLLRAGKRIGTSLMSNEERRFMWNLAFCFTIKYRGAAFKAYYAIRSFITYNGIFMGYGYGLGEDSRWNMEDEKYIYPSCSDEEEEEE